MVCDFAGKGVRWACGCGHCAGEAEIVRRENAMHADMGMCGIWQRGDEGMHL